MVTIIEDSVLGNYYKDLIPYVEGMCVSLDIETKAYSLECDKTYNHKQNIGLFYGYPGSMDLDGKFVPGINNANGLICIGNYDCIEVLDGIFKKKLIEESEIEKNTQNNLNSSSGHKIVPQCTIVECGINYNSELVVQSLDYNSNSSNKICGRFLGTPGEYYYDNTIKGYNRIYGNEHSIGIITLYGRFNFKYKYDKGQISSIVFNNINSLKCIQLLN
jgi:hypothetical protein